MPNPPSILFVHNDQASFVQADLDLLRARYRVTDMYLTGRRLNPAAIAAAVARHDLVFGWFASWHTALPVLFARLLGKPSLMVVGGYDLANMPEIGYGHQRGGLKKWVSRATIALTTCATTYSRFNQAELEKNVGLPASRSRVISLGVADVFGEPVAHPRPPIALTVGNVDQANLFRKGHEPFVRAAAHLPDVEFVLVGAWKDNAIEHLRAIATPNVHFVGRVSDAELLAHFRQAAVYVQASAHEGFGLSLAEAMLAGCVPVITRAGALPEVVGPAGVSVDSADPAALAAGICAGLAAEAAARRQARAHILESFPLERRSAELGRLIDHLIVGAP
jgi:glycosyltransferase involved in cell wall biosynthesis